MLFIKKKIHIARKQRVDTAINDLGTIVKIVLEALRAILERHEYTVFAELEDILVIYRSPDA